MIAILSLPACKSVNTPRQIHTHKSQTLSPETIVTNLEGDALKEYRKLLHNATLPDKNPYRDNTEKYNLYNQWYQRGYAYGWQSGNQLLRSQTWENDENQRAVLTGWHSGNSRALLEFENKKIIDNTTLLLQEAAAERSEPDRNRCIAVVNTIQDGDLSIPDSGIVKLPAPYTDLSLGGTIYASRSTNRAAAAFKTWRGKGRNMRGFVYLTAPLHPKEIETNYYGDACLHVGVKKNCSDKLNDGYTAGGRKYLPFIPPPNILPGAVNKNVINP